MSVIHQRCLRLGSSNPEPLFLYVVYFRYNIVPDLRRLALLDGIRSILSAHGPQSFLRNGGIDACLPMLLHGIDSADAGVVQAATDILLVSDETYIQYPSINKYR